MKAACCPLALVCSLVLSLGRSLPAQAGETIVYDDAAVTTGTMLQNGPPFSWNPNMLFPGTPASPGASNNSVAVNYDPSSLSVHNPSAIFGGLADNTEVRDNSVNLVNGSVGDVYGGFGGSAAATAIAWSSAADA